jgi:hypothetical protein
MFTQLTRAKQQRNMLTFKSTVAGLRPVKIVGSTFARNMPSRAFGSEGKRDC